MSNPYGLCDSCGEYHELSDVDGELLCEECHFLDVDVSEPGDEDE